MKILALEFSSEQRSAAALESGQEAAAAAAANSNLAERARELAVTIPPLGYASQTGPHGRKALGLIDAALREAQWEREQIEGLAIGLGPGSYTGIRAAIAVAQGWQLARPIKLLGISSVDCLAAQAQALGWHGRIEIIIEAQRNEFYLASFEISVVRRQELEGLRLATLEEVRAKAASAAAVVGPEATRWLAAGRALFPNAAMLAQLAMDRADFVAGDRLEPIYLRETAFVKAPPPRFPGTML
ncbi:MAG: tRNA (adenosine(37)-N6)-threonylcarbamoyltransferase complex dimerization subunit type 1 TsaB [Verrucomicrobiota bacterium]